MGRIRTYQRPGNFTNLNNQSSDLVHSGTSEMDEKYLVIGGHVDSGLQQRIIDFEYIDFAKLIPRDRVAKLDDHRFELIVKGNNTYFSPIANREVTGITNFSRWEQAFCIYSNVLARAYPSKVSELIQYNHIIYTASLTFAWENVYLYDKEFRIHISKFPQRNWSIILQQAWSMCLKDKLHEDNKNQTTGGLVHKVKEPCRRYNKGKCNMGARCKFEHRCAIKRCGKFGHGAHICRLRNKDEAGSSNGTPGRSHKNPDNNGRHTHSAQ